ncbi:hypothetical protein BS17DRAFT_683867, partial [Gyrodon lividus]
HSVVCYLLLEHALQKAYDGIMHSTCTNFPAAEGIDECLLFKAVESFIAKYTGVNYVLHDMCPDSCAMFTRPFENLDSCPSCSKSHWDE